MKVIGVISDTHGLLRSEAVTALEGSDLIVHAGDVGGLEVLRGLEAIAPTRAIRGNVDKGFWAGELPLFRTVEMEGVRLGVVHDLARLEVDPIAEDYAAVIFGHSHRPTVEERGGVLFLNPGSAGPRRFRLPVSVGRIVVDGGRVVCGDWVPLKV